MEIEFQQSEALKQEVQQRDETIRLLEHRLSYEDNGTVQAERESAVREKKLLDEIAKLNELVEAEKVKADKWERDLHSA